MAPLEQEVPMKYMFSLFAEETGWQDQTPEQIKSELGKWTEFGQEATDRGVFVAGDALQASSTATTVRIPPAGERTVTDGPFAETKEQLGGFYVLDCKNLDEALEYARKIPLRSGAVEVRPIADFSELTEEAPAAREGARS